MEWRAGYLRVPQRGAQHRARASTTSTEVGIPGANYDEFSSGISRIVLQKGFTVPMLGFSASLPWDRGEETYSVAGHAHEGHGQPHGEVRHRAPPQRATSCCRSRTPGGRAASSVQRRPDRGPERHRATDGCANAFASFLLDVPGQVQRDVKVIDRPGTKHTAVFAFIQDKWQVLAQADRRPRPALGVLHAARRHRGPGRAVELRHHQQHGADHRLRERPRGHRGRETWTNFAPRLGAAYRFDDQTVLRAGFGTTIVPFPDNRYAYNFPVKQTNQFNPPNSFAAAGRWPTASGRPTSSTSRRAASWTRTSRSSATRSSSTCSPT